jgi:hypothetical protein
MNVPEFKYYAAVIYKQQNKEDIYVLYLLIQLRAYNRWR